MTALTHASRSLARTPGFTAVVLVIIALGIGANTAIFSVLQAVLLRPLPLVEPERLVRLYETSDPSGTDQSRLNLSPQTWQYWRENNTVFTDIGRATGASLTLSGQGLEPQRLQASRISHNFFSVLGIAPQRGRDFREDDDKPGAAPAALISHGFWHRHFAGAETAVGSTLTLDNQLYTVVGVMPPHFRHPYRSEVWIPFAETINPATHTGRFLYAPARLKPGITHEQAFLAMRELCAQRVKEDPNPVHPKAASVVSLHGGFVQDIKPKLLAISIAAGFVLLIAGANIACLLLARQVDRAGETSLRSALGASRGRLVRESLCQSSLLAVAGSALGLLLAVWLVNPLLALSPMGSDATGNAMREFDTTVRLDPTVLGFSLGLTLLIGLGFGALPALRGSRGNLNDALKNSGRSGTLDRHTRRLLGTLVVAEVAVALVLLVATGLMIRSFKALLDRPWGFATENRLAFDVTFTNRLRPDHDARVDFVRQALQRIESLPGVRSASATTPHQMFAARSLAAVVPKDGTEPPRERGFFLVYHRMAMPGYFGNEGMRLVKGRLFDETDRAGGQRVAVITESMAKRFWPGEDPIGRELKRGRINDPRPGFVVVGVVEDIRAVIDPTDGDVAGSWILPYAQNPNFLGDNITFLVHAAVPPESLQAAIRSELAKIDPSLAPYDFNTLERMVDDTYASDRFALLLIGLFGALGLLLAAVGLYGLLAFQVARRTKEIGVRTALGATTRTILRLVFREGGMLVCIGTVAGIAASLGLTRIIQNQLNGVSAADPLSYLAAIVLLVLAAGLACWIPARRAARLNPVEALRAE
jgi:putative ABC transport system permease protein